MLRTGTLARMQNCQSRSDIGTEKMAGYRSRFARNNNAVRLETAPSTYKIGTTKLNRCCIGLELRYKLADGTKNQTPVNRPVAPCQSVLCDFFTELPCQSVVMILAGVVIPRGGQVDQTSKVTVDLRQGSRIEIAAGCIYVRAS